MSTDSDNKLNFVGLSTRLLLATLYLFQAYHHRTLDSIHMLVLTLQYMKNLYWQPCTQASVVSFDIFTILLFFLLRYIYNSFLQFRLWWKIPMIYVQVCSCTVKILFDNLYLPGVHDRKFRRKTCWWHYFFITRLNGNQLNSHKSGNKLTKN